MKARSSLLLFLVTLTLVSITSSSPTGSSGNEKAKTVVVNIQDLGAVGDGRTLNTAAFRRSVSLCESLTASSSSLTCTLLIPAGRFLTGAFNLTSNVNLHVHEGGVLLGSGRLEDYPVVAPFPSYCTGREKPGPRYGPLVGGVNLTNVMISGHGIIDGQGKYFWDRFHRGEMPLTRMRLVEFENCENLHMENITLVNSPFWTVHPIYCNNVLIRNITINNPRDTPNTDGIDPDSSSNVLIENCVLQGGDDNIAIKSGMDYCGRLVNRPSVNITVRNCIVPYGNGFCIGSEASGGVHNVLIENMLVGTSLHNCYVKTAPGRGGIISDIHFRNITVLGVSRTGLHVNMNYTGSPPTNQTATPIVRNITFEDVNGNAKYAGIFNCIPESPCTCTVVDSRWRAEAGFSCVNATIQSSDVSPAMCAAPPVIDNPSP